MTRGLQNWLVLGVALILFVALAAVIAGLQPDRRVDPERRPSSYFTGPEGTRALFLVMEELLPSVTRRRDPLLHLPSANEPSGFATLIVAEPGRELSGREADALEDWIQAGGQLILCGPSGWPIRSGRPGEAPPGPDRQGTKPSKQEATPEEDGRQARERAFRQRYGLGPESDSSETGSSESRSGAEKEGATTFLGRYGIEISGASPEGAREGLSAEILDGSVESGSLRMRVHPGWSWTGEFRTLIAVEGRPVAVGIELGEGRILSIADPLFLTNGMLRGSDNAVWLVRQCAGWGDGSVAFDEYHHGFGPRAGTLALVGRFLITPWGWVVLQLIAAGLLYLLVYRRPLGRRIEEVPTNRRSAMELMKARAGLFRMARAHHLGAEALLHYLHQELEPSAGPCQDLGAFLDRQRERAGSEGLKQLWREVQLLYDRCRLNGSLSDADFLRLGRLTGNIRQEIRRD